MAGKAVLVGFGLVPVGIGILLWGAIGERTPLFVLGLVLTILGPAIVTVSLIWLAVKGDRDSDYLAPFANRKAYLEAARGTRTFDAAVRSARNGNSMRGASHFGTEIDVDVLIDDDVVEGVVRQYLTPAQIAAVGPGADIRVKPVPTRPGQYIIDWPAKS